MGEGSSEQEGTERGVGFIEGMCGRAEVGGRKVEDQRRDVINSRKKKHLPLIIHLSTSFQSINI